MKSTPRYYPAALRRFIGTAQKCAIILVVFVALYLGRIDPQAGGILFAMAGVTTDNIKYGTSTAITCTTSGLAASTTVGRQCTVIDNTSNLFDDALVTVSVRPNASTPAANQSCLVYLFGSEDGTVYDSDAAQPGATDAGYTISTTTNLRGPVVISTPLANTVYTKVFSVAQFFNGLMPRKWGFVIINDTNNALSTTATTFSYTGITFTNT